MTQRDIKNSVSRGSSLASLVFSRRIRVEYETNGQGKPCELRWLNSFSTRNFTNDAVFDDTLPVSQGLVEVGAVPLDALRSSMEDGFRRKSYIGKSDRLFFLNPDLVSSTIGSPFRSESSNQRVCARSRCSAARPLYSD